MRPELGGDSSGVEVECELGEVWARIAVGKLPEAIAGESMGGQRWVFWVFRKPRPTHWYAAADGFSFFVNCLRAIINDWSVACGLKVDDVGSVEGNARAAVRIFDRENGVAWSDVLHATMFEVAAVDKV